MLKLLQWPPRQYSALLKLGKMPVLRSPSLPFTTIGAFGIAKITITINAAVADDMSSMGSIVGNQAIGLHSYLGIKRLWEMATVMCHSMTSCSTKPRQTCAGRYPFTAIIGLTADT